MATSEEDHNVYNPEDLDDDEEDEEESNPTNKPNSINNPSGNDDEDDDVDVDEDDDVGDSTSSSNLAAADHPHLPDPSLLNRHHPPPPSVVVGGGVTAALPDDHSILPPDFKRQRIDEVTIASVSASAIASAVVERKKPIPLDESRRLFQRLWTDEDEIELLQGFLEYTTSKGVINSSHHHDTTAFYDQIKSKLQLDFNKNQLVEKLRRLKKKYRTVMNKMGSGKEYVFKSPHDQATFEISRKIWSGNGGGAAAGCGGSVVVEEGGLDDDEANNNFSINFIDQSPNPNLTPNHNPNGIDSFEKKTQRSRKRSRGGGVKFEEKQFVLNSVPNLQHSEHQNVGVGVGVGVVSPIVTPVGAVTATAVSGSGHVTNLIEETVRSCLSPIFKELLNSVASLNGPMSGSRGFGFALTPMPLGLNGDMVTDEKWRKQQMLELDVYSKRLELVQDQIKAQLEELRSMGS
ncbi:hypothetical protein ACH5RR_001241 [Cinchona calisaya]|uniref:Glabrous enhancer-binding protein-like DBD domain-containing protein n=1 Tax=Cinchona calisaya TaxID=153742 RepID=A0ABD3B3D7_9GENT